MSPKCATKHGLDLGWGELLTAEAEQPGADPVLLRKQGRGKDTCWGCCLLGDKPPQAGTPEMVSSKDGSSAGFRARLWGSAQQPHKTQ